MLFKENLESLPAAKGKQLVLLDESGVETAVIANGMGMSGSFRVYAYLASKWGGINADAAEEGLRIYAEHTDDARHHPGKHPNIDRLMEIQSAGKSYRVRIE